MRQVNREVVERFLGGSVYPQGIWGYDRALYSYGVRIAYKELETPGGKLLVRLLGLPPGMSQTTMRHRELVRRVCEEMGVTVVVSPEKAT